MNKVHVNQGGGFPLETNTLSFVQDTIFFIGEAVSSLAGELVIIKGCEQNGNYVKAGIVVINKELMPFKGGALGKNVVIQETKKKKTFESGESKDVYFSRIAAFGTGNPMFKWSEFKRIKDIKGILERISNILNTIENLHLNWERIDNKPTHFKPEEHKHKWSEITNKPTLFPSYEYSKMEMFKFVWDSSVQSDWDFSSGIVMYTPFGLGICFLELWRSQAMNELKEVDNEFEFAPLGWWRATVLPEELRPAEDVALQVRLMYKTPEMSWAGDIEIACKINKTGGVFFKDSDKDNMKVGLTLVGYATYHVRRPDWKK